MSIFNKNINKNINKNKARAESLTWEQFLNELSVMLDNDIISFAQNTGKIYLGGKCNFSAIVAENEFSRNTYLITKADMYYKKQFVEGAEIRTLSLKRNFNSFDFKKDESTLEKLREIVNNPCEININHPVIKNQKDGE